jgi:stress-induced morphogen
MCIQKYSKTEKNVIIKDIQDTSNGCGQCFEVVLVSAAFQGKPLLARHKLINSILKDQLPHIHAFSQVGFLLFL